MPNSLSPFELYVNIKEKEWSHEYIPNRTHTYTLMGLQLHGYSAPITRMIQNCDSYAGRLHSLEGNFVTLNQIDRMASTWRTLSSLYLWLAWQKPETTLEKSLAPRVPLPWTNVHSSFILRAKCFVRGEVRHTWPPLLHTHPQQGLSTDRGKWPAYHNLVLIHDGFKKSRNLYAVKPNLQAAERWQAIATVFHSQGHDYPEECSIHWKKSQYQLYAFLPNP